MSQWSFKVDIQDGRVAVKHRVPPLWANAVGLVATLIGLCMIPAALNILAEARASHSLALGIKAGLFFCAPLVGLLAWRFFSHAGEVMECDAKELHHARQKTWGGWRRRRFSVPEIQGLHMELRNTGKSRYRLLAFQYDRERIEMLLSVKQEDANRILEACRSIGVDVG